MEPENQEQTKKNIADKFINFLLDDEWWMICIFTFTFNKIY